MVSRTANAEGTFLLVRNVTGASGEVAVIHATLGDGDPDALRPRETSLWECDAAAMPLTLRTDDGTVIYDAPVECGDALYVRRDAAVTGVLR